MRKKLLTITIVVLLLTLSVSMIACDKPVDLKDYVFDDEIKDIDASLMEGTNLRVMSYNIQVGAWGGKKRGSAKERAARYEQIVIKYLPDVIALQEVDESYHMNFTATTKANYKVMFNGLTNYTSMAYNVNKVELLDKGIVKYSKHNEKVIQMMRYIAWGAFKHKESGKTFICTSTHLDFHPNEDIMNLQVDELAKFVKEKTAEYDNCPIFAMGDYNVQEKVTTDKANCNEVYLTIPTKTGLVDANYIEGIDVKEGPRVEYADPEKDGYSQHWNDPKWDHIFTNSASAVKRFGIVSPKYCDGISDHYPIYLDVAL